MKTIIRGATRTCLKVLCAVYVGIVFAPATTRGQVNYFFGGTANGPWDTTSALWSTPTYSTSGLTQWVDGNIANIDSGTAASRTLTLMQDITAQSLLFDARATTPNNYTENYVLAGAGNTLNLTSGNITFNFLSGNSAGVINAQIDANVSTAGDLTVNVQGITNSPQAFGNTQLTLTGATTFNNLNIYGGYLGTASSRGVNAVFLDHNATLTGTVNLYGYDGTNSDGASFAVGTTTSNAVLVSANNFVINPNNVHGAAYIPNDFIARIGAAQNTELDVNGVISGNGDLMVSAGFSGGAGLVVLNQPNTYLGSTIFNAAGSSSTGPGVLQLGVNNAIPTGSKLVWGFNTNSNGGTLDLNGFNQQVSSISTPFTAADSVITNNSFAGPTSVSTLTISGSDSPGSFSMPINDGASGGKVALVRSGTGTTILTNPASSYSGGTTILGGTLSVDQDTELGSPVGSNTLTIGGGTLAITGSGFTLNSNRPVAVGPSSGSGNATISVAPVANLTYNGAITNNGSGTGGLIVMGGGTLTLTGANSYTGPTQISNSTLALVGAGASLHTSSAVTIAPTGTLSGTGTAAGSVTVGGTIAPGTYGASPAVGQFNVGSLALSGGGAFSFRVADATSSPGTGWDFVSVNGGTGTLTLNNTSTSKFTINIQAGPSGISDFVSTQSYTWQIINAGALAGNAFTTDKFNVNGSGFGAGNPGSSFTISNQGSSLYINYIPGGPPLVWVGGTGNWTATGGTSWSGGPWNSTRVAEFTAGSGVVTLQDPIVTQGLQFDDGANYTIAGSGANTLTAPTIQVGTGGNAATTTATVSAQLVGNAGLLKTGGGTLILTGANTYTGTTTVATGTLQASSTSLPTDIIVNGALVFDQPVDGAFANALSGAGPVTKQNSGTLALTGNNSGYTGPITIAAGAISIDSGARLGGGAAALTLNGGTLRASANITSTPISRLINVGTGANPATGAIDTNGFNVTLNGGSATVPQIALPDGSTFIKKGNGELTFLTNAFSHPSGVLNGTVEVDGGTLTLGDKNSTSSNPQTFFGLTGLPNGLVLKDGTNFTVAASTSGNSSLNTLSSLSMTGNVTFTIYRTASGGALSMSPSLTNGSVSTPLTLNGTLTVAAAGNISANTPRLTVGGLTLTGPSTLQMMSNSTVSTNFTTQTGQLTDNGFPLNFYGQGTGTNLPGAGIRINSAGGTSHVSGNWTIGAPDGTQGVIVSYGAADNTALTTGPITVNRYGQLMLFSNGTAGASFDFGTAGQTLTLNGIGPSKDDFSAVTGVDGALAIGSGSATLVQKDTYHGNIVLASDAYIDSPNGTAGPSQLTLLGTIAGPGTLHKAGGGNLIVLSSNTGPSFAEDVLVGNGTITVGDGSPTFGGSTLPGGNLTLGETSASTGATTTVEFKNVAQTIGNLTSTFAVTAGTATQTIKLTGGSFGGTVLTINETGNTTFGVGSAPTINSTISGVGSIVLGSSATGTLTFTSANTYTGGTTINGGKLELAGAPLGAIYGGDVAINANGILGVNATGNLVAGNPLPPPGANTTATALINSGGTMSIDSDFDASPMVDPNSVGILALNTNNSTLSGTNGSSAFIGAFGAELLTVAALAPGAGGTYRLGGRGGSLTVTQGVLVGPANTLVIGSTQPNGSGTVILAAANTFGGGTTVNNGTLRTTADGALSTGGLAVNATATASSAASIQSNETVSSLSSTVAAGGSATLTVAAGKILTDNQAGNTAFAGVVALKSGASPGGGGTLVKSGAGTLEINAAPLLGTNSSLQVNTTGQLKFNVSSGTATVGAGSTVMVSDSAVLELAGPVSALGTAGAGRADITNTSIASAGLSVTGTNQRVGGINGTGTTQVNAGSDLTANHIIQSALVIGGAPGMTGLVTIATSDSSGNPLIATPDSSGSDSFAALPAGGDGLLGAMPAALGGLTPMIAEGAAMGGSGSAVPEPSTIGLCLLAILAIGSARCRRQRSAH